MNKDPRVEAEVERLNKQFYESFDTEYFLQKCLYLVALLGNPDLVADTLKKGVGFKSLKLKLDGEDNELITPEKMERNLKAEVATTYFHAIETLFRIIFAHAQNTDCPWVDLTVNNSFKKFKADVEAFTKHEYFKVDHTQGISLIFYGRTDKPSKVAKGVWDKGLLNISDFLDYFGNDLTKSYAYNSYKHGLAMFSDEFGFSLGDVMKVDKDDALVFLSFADDEGNPGYKRLHRNFTFTKWEQKWALVHQLTHLLDEVMRIGNWRYNKGDYEIKIFDKLDLHMLISSKDNPIQPTTVSEGLYSFKLSK